MENRRRTIRASARRDQYDNVIVGRFPIREPEVSASWNSRIASQARIRRQRQKRLRQLIVVILMVVAFCVGFFGRNLFNAYAKEDTPDPDSRYYTSIQLKQGDNLWKIASRYAGDSGCSVREYVDELVRMNGLREGQQIHSGEYLTVFYCSD